MKQYEFEILCGCHCVNCHNAVHLTGVDDADGIHVCFNCSDFTDVFENTCNERTEEKVKDREQKIQNSIHMLMFVYSNEYEESKS